MQVYYNDVLAGIKNQIKIVQNPDLEKGFRRKVMVIITMDVHSRDVIELLIENKIRKATEFQW